MKRPHFIAAFLSDFSDIYFYLLILCVINNVSEDYDVEAASTSFQNYILIPPLISGVREGTTLIIIESSIF